VIVSLYFFLVDGRKLSAFVRRNSFFDPAQTEKLMQGLATMARSVIMASLLGALAQTLIMLTALLVSGLPNPGLVAFLVFMTSFVPLVGSAPVTFGATLVGWAQSGPGVGGVLLAGAILTGLADNLVRPWVLKGGADLHPLVGFVAAFGGLQLFGLSGLFLGPIVAGLMIAIVRLHARD
jgi:predicted PurR-regulated permease PerM